MISKNLLDRFRAAFECYGDRCSTILTSKAISLPLSLECTLKLFWALPNFERQNALKMTILCGNFCAPILK